MSRFKTSKYRNTFARVFKKENWIHDLNVGSNLKSNTTHIKASCQYVAFIHDSTSVGSVALLPLNSSGRNPGFPTVAGHSGLVTDFDFSPFYDSLLVTGGEDGVVKVWQIPDEGLSIGQSCLCNVSLGPVGDAIENLHFNTVADNVLAGSVGTNVYVWDLLSQQQKYVFSQHHNAVQCFCWNGSGTLMATVSKMERQKHVQIYDPRCDKIVADGKCHSLTKDSFLTWLGDSPYCISTGYSQSREAEIALWDIGNMSKPLTVQTMGNNTGTPLTFYDEDSKMLFVGIKGETSICFYELTDQSLCLGPNSYCGTVQQKGLCMIPKRAVDVMSCEINRFLILSQNAIVPVGFHVQKKSYSEFHADLYPDTSGPIPAVTVDQWLAGSDAKIEKVSLNPSKRKLVDKHVPLSVDDKVKSSSKKSDGDDQIKSEAIGKVKSEIAEKVKSPVSKDEVDSSAPSIKVVNIVRSSKVRYIEGYHLHKNNIIDKIPQLSKSIPGDSNAFTANKVFAAVALSATGSQIAVFELNKPGRVDTHNVFTLQNVSGIMDFIFDPFNTHRLIVACDDARIKVWDIPNGGLTETLTQPKFSLTGHYEKPNILAYHPQAKDILASAGYDGKIFIWNIKSKKIEITLEPLDEPLFAMSWSRDGTSLCTLGRDHIIRLYKPRESTVPISTGTGPSGSRGARLLWLDDDHIIISGFDKGSQRLLCLYKLSDLTCPLSVLELNTSPAILVPYYDPDIQVIYLTGKGDSVILTVEYCPTEDPYLFLTAPFTCSSPHQAIAFLPKILCDVRKVEVGRGVRLCSSSIDPFGFKIPRVKTEYFQDDLYCDLVITWESALTAEEWLSGTNRTQGTVSLKPEGMKLLSEVPKTSVSNVKKYPTFNPREKSDQEKKDELISAMINKMGDKEEDPLPQDSMDGVDSDEWDDY